jgi:hypothetical protein
MTMACNEKSSPALPLESLFEFTLS